MVRLAPRNVPDAALRHPKCARRNHVDRRIARARQFDDASGFWRCRNRDDQPLGALDAGGREQVGADRIADQRFDAEFARLFGDGGFRLDDDEFSPVAMRPAPVKNRRGRSRRVSGDRSRRSPARRRPARACADGRARGTRAGSSSIDSSAPASTRSRAIGGTIASSSPRPDQDERKLADLREADRDRTPPSAGCGRTRARSDTPRSTCRAR